MSTRRWASEDGFNLIEIIVALAVVAAALAIAFPMFNSAPQNLAADLQDFSLNLQVAREFAVSRTIHYHVAVAAGGPPYRYAIEHCDTTVTNCTVPSSWVPERTIALRPNVSFSSLPTPASAEFDTRGLLVVQTGQSAPVTFTLQDTARGWSKQVTVNGSGMVDRP
jgi:prepilin-type N-terminal cleavage/methylation domain-containing protein